MNFIIEADTDIGILRQTNQDSLAAFVADSPETPVAFAIVCDGMGGLEKGELASATVILAFENWFKNVLPALLEEDKLDDGIIRSQWTSLLVRNNELIKKYGIKNGLKLGTTASAILITSYRYYAVNVGDSRIYELKDTIKQITEDHTFIARELKCGRMTPEQAKNDPRGSVLLQCIGASKEVNPDFFFGSVDSNTCYLLCSDGFRHKITKDEMYKTFCAENNTTSFDMHQNIRNVIEINKSRMEKDNITAVLVKAV
jgi:serine/threonine protein phosphatase PrpC